MLIDHYEEFVQVESIMQDGNFNFGFIANMNRLPGENKFKPLLLPEQINCLGVTAFTDDELEVISDTIANELNDNFSNDEIISKDMVDYSENVFVNAFGKFSTNFRFKALKKLTIDLLKSSTILTDRFKERAKNFGLTDTELEELIEIIRLNRFTQDY